MCYSAFLVFGCVLPVCWILECAVVVVRWLHERLVCWMGRSMSGE